MSIKRRGILAGGITAAVAAPMMAQSALVGRRDLPRAGATILRFTIEQLPNPSIQMVIHLWYHTPNEGTAQGESVFAFPNATRLPNPVEIIQFAKQEVVRYAKQHTLGIDITVQEVVIMSGLLFH